MALNFNSLVTSNIFIPSSFGDFYFSLTFGKIYPLSFIISVCIFYPQNHAAFLRAAGSGIPGRSVDDVRQHDEWYSEYLMLKDSKKKAIQEWKEGKEVQFTFCLHSHFACENC